MKDETGHIPLTPDLLMRGYASGIFPMAEHRDDPEVFWVDPRRRGVLPLGAMRVSRSLRRRMRKSDVSVTLNECFEDVLSACADRSETWINDEIASLYLALHRRGQAHSMEVWYGDALAGGVYGVNLGAAFFGESMFSHARDGSKIALTCLTHHLHACGYALFDTQFITDHLASLGAYEISRREYHLRLRRAVSSQVDRLSAVSLASPQELVQRITQTS